MQDRVFRVPAYDKLPGQPQSPSDDARGPVKLTSADIEQVANLLSERMLSPIIRRPAFDAFSVTVAAGQTFERTLTDDWDQVMMQVATDPVNSGLKIGPNAPIFPARFRGFYIFPGVSRRWVIQNGTAVNIDIVIAYWRDIAMAFQYFGIDT